MSGFYFASCDHNAKRFLASDAYKWLSQAAKDFVANNLAEDLQKGFRVQDPMMHPKPQLMTQNAELYKAVVELNKQKAPTND